MTSHIANLLFSLGKKNNKLNGQLPVVLHDSPEWKAWRAWRVEHGEPVDYMDRVERFTVPSQYPPASLDALKAEVSAGSVEFKT